MVYTDPLVMPLTTDPSEGIIGRNATSQQIDRESVSSYELIIQATDGGNQPMSSTARVLVEILVRFRLISR